MREKIEEVTRDLEHMMKLTNTYPYLGNDLWRVVERLSERKKELEEIDRLEDLKDYQGDSSNKIDKERDDLSVIKAKLQAQREWISKNK